MNITPIESILHHRPNCNCEACARNLKPFRAGRFVDKDEMDGIHAHVQELAAENERLSALLVQLQKREEERAELAKVEAIRQEQQRLELAKIEAIRETKRRMEEDSDDEEPRAKSKTSKTVTIVLDNTKLVYAGIMIVVLIMVLKK